MHSTKRLVVLFMFSVSLLVGCTTAEKTTSSVSELPAPGIAKEEAKEALREWQVLLENGQNAEFIQESMPGDIYKMAIDDNGNLKKSVLDRLRAFAPKVVNALNEAQYLEPEIVGNNVVFTYTDIHTSGGFFVDDKLYLTKKDGRWFFNGSMIKEVSKM